MAGKIILVDTSILIEYFRKTDKANATWMRLFDEGYDFCISAITHYEIYAGATAGQRPFWNHALQRIQVLPMDETVSQMAVDLNGALKKARKQIGMADLFIAATAVAHKLPLATLNKKHFERIDTLTVLP